MEFLPEPQPNSKTLLGESPLLKYSSKFSSGSLTLKNGISFFYLYKNFPKIPFILLLNHLTFLINFHNLIFFSPP